MDGLNTAIDTRAGATRTLGRQQFTLAVCVVVGLTSIVRFWAAWFEHGVFWPDEIFQSIEQAHRVVFGYGTIPWEFRRGARSWVFPGLLAGLLKLGVAVGLDSGRSLVLLAKTCMALVSLCGVYLTMSLARQLAGTAAAVIAGLFSGFFAASILLGSRCSAETVSGPIVTAAVILAMRRGTIAQVAAGTLAGLSIYLRYQTGLIAAGLLAVAILERRKRDAMHYAAALIVVGVLGGLVDWFTWGKPFHAFRMYLWFNLFKSAAKYGAYPFGYYAEVAWNITGLPLVMIVAGFIRSAWVAPKLVTIAALYVFAHSIVPHKELRFLMPVMPLFFALSGAGCAMLLRRARHGEVLGILLAVGCAAWMAVSSAQLTWEKVGFPSDRGARSPWHSGEGINRLLWVVGEREDACGVIVTGENIGWIGGYTYLHRNIPMFGSVSPHARAAANYWIALASDARTSGYEKIDQIREFALYRRPGTCGEPPSDHKQELPY